MIESLHIFAALASGILIGVFFFGGLWWTVQRGMVTQSPAILFLTSLLVRTGIAVSAFILTARGDWRNLIAILVGFLIARAWITRLSRTGQAAGSACAGSEGAPQS